MIERLTDSSIKILREIREVFEEADHVWIPLWLFIAVLVVWIGKPSPWLESLGKELITAIITLLTSRSLTVSRAKRVSRNQSGEIKETDHDDGK